MNESFLWGVPKKQLPLERRLRKRFGHPRYPNNCAVLRPRSDLVICEHCGDHHEAFTICRTCYAEVRAETEMLKKEIKAQTNPLEPKEQEIRFKFEGSNLKNEDDHKFRLIEIPRPMPNWFSKNLLAKSLKSKNSSSDVILNQEDSIPKQ